MLNAGNSILYRLVRFVFICIQFARPESTNILNSTLVASSCPAMSALISETPELFASSCTAISPLMSSEEYVQALIRQRLAPERVSITTKTGRRVIKVDIRYAINDSTMGTL